jgi:hypothetical protein
LTQNCTRPLHNGDTAVALFNVDGGAPAGITLVANGEYCANAQHVGKPGNNGFGSVHCFSFSFAFSFLFLPFFLFFGGVREVILLLFQLS